MDNIDIKIILLVFEECCGEIPESVREKAEHCECGFVDEGGGRVPWLDLLAEDDFDFWVSVREMGEDGGLDGGEHFRRKRANIV